MKNQEINSRTMDKSTRSSGRRQGAFNALSKIWLALAVGFLLIPGVARAQQYVFENIAFPGDTFTQLLSINDADVIAGYHGQAINQGFTLNLPNNFTSENFPGSVQTQATGINNAGNTSGFYIDSGGQNHGFLNTGGVFSTVDFPGTTTNQVLGLNNTGQAAGFFVTSGNQTPFIFNPFLPPTAQFVIGGMGGLPAVGQATDINDKGMVTGFFPTATGDDGFLLSAGKLTALSFPGATVTEALGLNNLGQVVGFYNDAAGNPHGFIYSNGSFTSLDDNAAPATQTTINGINNFGQIVGFALEKNGNTVGFVGAPLVVPEPSLLSLLALGSTALVGMCILRSRRLLR
jgi:probable HAF family extracellular repeat protein